MNELLKTYQISVEFNNVSGAEFLDLLSIRDELTELNLTVEEQKLLTKADQILLKHCPLICQELSRFINLSEYRKQHNIKPQQWWWYLDVLVNIRVDGYVTIPHLSSETVHEPFSSHGYSINLSCL